ncbi:cytochrome P450 [Sphingomonas sp.]|uniref:cytochrome P450 n=1 Tax=Sphingomonas sp. TaxID=28214 RepID=UPI003D6C774C
MSSGQNAALTKSEGIGPDGIEPDGIEDVSFADPAFLADPWTPLIRLQEEAPVYYSKNQGGWIISRYEDVRAAFADRRLSAARVDQLFRGMPTELQERLAAVRLYTGLIVNRLDGRDHMRIRVLMLKAFDRGAIRKVESFIAEVVDEVLDDCARLGTFDFMKTVSAALPTRVMQRLFGLPDEYQPLLFKLASDFTAASSAATVTPELLLQLDQSIRTMNEVFNTFIPEREKNPGDDLISLMVHARDGLSKLSNDEMLAQLHGMVVAGAETTAHTLATQLVKIVENPALAQRLRDDPACAFNLTTELLRYPGTVKCMTRFAGEDLEIRGTKIAKGDLLWIMHAGANIDARVFDDPFETDIDRANLRDSMAFGPGLHFCVGHMLARTELTEFFTRAFQRFDVEILQQEFEMVPSYIFYGYRELRVRFTPR